MAFLKAVMRHPRVKFAFNSSIMRKNILPIINNMFIQCDESGLFSEYMFCLFDQEYNQKSREVTGERFGLIRDLEKVWASEKVQNCPIQLDKSNTLMLETDEITVYNCHENSLIIDRFERRDIWPMAGDEDFRDQADILRQIKDDIFEVLDKCKNDVPAFLKEAEFKSEYVRRAKKLEPRGEKPDLDDLTGQMEKMTV